MPTRVESSRDGSSTLESVAAWTRALTDAARAGIAGSPLSVSGARASSPAPAEGAPSDRTAPDWGASADHAAPDWGTSPDHAAPGGVASPDRITELVDLLTALENLTAAAAAVQARAAVELDTAERARQAALGIPAEKRGLGVAGQVALARRVSPHRGASLLGAAKAWCTEMPHTFDALATGHLSEHRATLLVRETACLSLEVREEVDRLMCAVGPDGRRSVDGLGDSRVVGLARQHAARLEPASLVRRAQKATDDRCVTLRPAPDTMTYLTALVPVAQGVAAYASLRAAASSARSSGDPRGLGQVMADTLVERLTGQASAESVPVAVQLVVSDDALLAAGSEPAHVIGGGAIPAAVARTLTANALDADAAWLRRIYTDPRGRLTATSSQDRFFAGGLADLLRVRDLGTCRTPWCDAPTRHLDHVVPAERNGPTDQENGQGLCEACNQAKQAPGWSQTTDPETDLHTVRTTTPSGHRYLSRAPDLPRPLRTWHLDARATLDRSRDGVVGTMDADDAALREMSPLEAELAALLAEFHVA